MSWCYRRRRHEATPNDRFGTIVKLGTLGPQLVVLHSVSIAAEPLCVAAPAAAAAAVGALVVAGCDR